MKVKNMDIDELYDELESENIDDEELNFEFEKDDYEKASDEMLARIKKLSDGEEKTRAIGDLKAMQEIAINRQKLEYEKRLKKEKTREEMKLKKEQLKKELELKERNLETKEEELALREEELKAQKRNGILGIVGRFLEIGCMFVGYNYLLNKQNDFESRDSYSTAGSRGLVNNISHFGGNIGRR